MKGRWLILTVFIVSGVLLLEAGCEEQERVGTAGRYEPEWRPLRPRIAVPRTQTIPKARRGAPQIRFEKYLHDFGKIGPSTSNLCEFKFTNTGSGILKIAEVSKTCGCTPFTLAKREYAPGESGTLKVNYYSEPQLGEATKRLFVQSNDKTRPKIPLTIKAMVVTKVDYQPKKLNLLLKGENAGCPRITLTSLDNQPFSISGFKSTANCITADYNPSVKAASFVLQPKVDMEKLKSALNGRIEISLTHPECKTITVLLNTLPNFKVSPPLIIVREAKPRQPIRRKVRVVSNYQEDFELESMLSTNDIIKVLSSERIDNGYELELEVIPPKAGDKTRYFTDEFFVKIKGGDRLQIPCNGFYSGRGGVPQTSAKSKECKTCGGREIKFELVNTPGGG